MSRGLESREDSTRLDFWNLLDVFMKIQKKGKEKSNNNLNYFLLLTLDAFSFM